MTGRSFDGDGVGRGKAVRPSVISACALLFAAAGSPADAFTLLTAGKVGRFRSGPGGEPAALVRVTRDPALRTVADPRCPATSSIGFADASEAQIRVDHGETPLPCTHWRATGSGFRYLDPAGTAAGVREILYAPGRLLVRAGGPTLPAVAGPVIYVEAFLGVASKRYLIRFYDFRRNDADLIVSRRPSRAAAAGEAAFWETLSGTRPRKDRAMALLRQAVRRDPRDGRSQFYLGALHLYRGGPVPDPSTPASPSGAADLRAAQAPLDRAVELLPHDSVPAVFRALTTYLNGFVEKDPARTARGLAQLEEASTRNRFFNKSVELFIVPRFYSGTSESYPVQLQRLDEVFTEATAHPDTYPDVFTSRLVPHDPEGAGLFFGDVAAKGGRLAEAQLWYGIAQRFGRASGYPFQAIVEERVAHAAERVALYQDGDPGNDPSILGGQGLSPCTYCHYGTR